MGENKNMKLAIGLPLTSDRVHTQFLDSFIKMDKPEFVYCRPMFPTNFTTEIAMIRNEIVKIALRKECTHLLFMDTDQVYAEDTIYRLLAHNKDIVGAKVHIRYPPFIPTIFRFDEEVGKQYVVDEEEWTKRQLLDVDATGTGCLLIKTDVFRNIEFPWFEFSVDKYGETIGEDINFCRKVKNFGYKIYVDTSINCGHLGTLEVNESTYFINKLIMREKNGR